MVERPNRNSIIKFSTSNGLVDLGVLDGIVGYHVRRVSNVFLTEFNESVSGTGMRQVLFAILCVVSANPGIAQGKVGESLGVQRNNMAAFANELEQQGLLHRATVENDRRTLALRITPEGQRMLDECLVRIQEHEDRLLADCSPADRAHLVELLSRIERKERRS